MRRSLRFCLDACENSKCRIQFGGYGIRCYHNRKAQRLLAGRNQRTFGFSPPRFRPFVLSAIEFSRDTKRRKQCQRNAAIRSKPAAAIRRVKRAGIKASPCQPHPSPNSQQKFLLSYSAMKFISAVFGSSAVSLKISWRSPGYILPDTFLQPRSFRF